MHEDRTAKAMFIGTLAITTYMGSFYYGAYSHENQSGPWPLLNLMKSEVLELISPSDAILESAITEQIEPSLTSALLESEGQLLLVAADVAKRRTIVRVMDRSGDPVIEYPTLFENIWPKGEGEFANGRPRKDMYVHGIAMLPDASIVANLAQASTFRMDVCGNVLWKLDNLGHHSVHLNDDGTLWVGSEDHFPRGSDVPYKYHEAPFRSWVLQKINADGETLLRIPVVELLLKNGLHGLVHGASAKPGGVAVEGDTLHLNDIESFPLRLKPGFFTYGDVVISLRHGGAIVVFNEETLQVKFASIGKFFGQHDPDFVSGDTLRVFNNRSYDANGKETSRILELSAPDGTITTVFEPSAKEAFYTPIFGAHQVLDNGHSLIAEVLKGRLKQYDSEGQLVWQWENRTAPDKRSSIYNAELLPPHMDENFFKAARKRCL